MNCIKNTQQVFQITMYCNDIWLEIFKYAGNDELFHLKHTSHQLKELIDIHCRLYNINILHPKDFFKMIINRQDFEGYRYKDFIHVKFVKDMFMLTTKDLKDVHVEYISNFNYDSAFPEDREYLGTERLIPSYHINYVIDIAFAKYKSTRNFMALNFIIRLDECEYDYRCDKLVYELSKYGLSLRNSNMCESYINTGSGLFGETLEEVVEIKREMDFLYKYTDYKTILKELLDYCEDDFMSDSRPVVYNLCMLYEDAKLEAVTKWRKENEKCVLTNLPKRILEKL